MSEREPGRARLVLGIIAALVVVAALGYFLARGLHPKPPAMPPPSSPVVPPATAPLPPTIPPVAHADLGAGPPTHARVLLAAPWGSGPGQLGRRSDPESMAVGPMSFFVDGKGVVILDGVNRRLARFDRHGAPLGPIALDSDAAQDLARARDRVAVLDRLHDKRVTLYDPDGSVRANLPLAAAGLADPAAATGIFADRDGALYVEREHGAWLPLAAADGTPARSPQQPPGRPTRDGQYVAAAISNRAAGQALVTLYSGATPPPSWQAMVDFGAPLLFVALLDSDTAGRVYIGAHTGHEAQTPPYAITDETLVIVALSAHGHEAGRIALPAPPPHEEAFRDLYVGDDGTIYWMRRTAAGVVVEAYRI
jgi:hypothetical protein